ncbi:MAG: hypothetical protein LBB14_03665 [Puniceicoccales bacterium]|jgi:hypothetical protein|nr:hypothetical protein [Puniceicoccales bacterium]
MDVGFNRFTPPSVGDGFVASRRSYPTAEKEAAVDDDNKHKRVAADKRYKIDGNDPTPDNIKTMNGNMGLPERGDDSFFTNIGAQDLIESYDMLMAFDDDAEINIAPADQPEEKLKPVELRNKLKELLDAAKGGNLEDAKKKELCETATKVGKLLLYAVTPGYFGITKVAIDRVTDNPEFADDGSSVPKTKDDMNKAGKQRKTRQRVARAAYTCFALTRALCGGKKKFDISTDTQNETAKLRVQAGRLYFQNRYPGVGLAVISLEDAQAKATKAASANPRSTVSFFRAFENPEDGKMKYAVINWNHNAGKFEVSDLSPIRKSDDFAEWIFNHKPKAEAAGEIAL